jgi:hypothetical protein
MNAKGFISTLRPGIARAERNGNGTWKVETLLPDVDVRCLTVDPHHPDTVWAGTQGAGLLRSPDRGRTWEPAGLDGQIVKSLAFSPSEPGRMVAGLKPPLVMASTDGGATWEELTAFRKIPSRPFWRSPAEPPGVAYVQSLAISADDPNIILAGIEVGAVVRSLDGGQTWEGHRRGAVRDCHTLIFHAADSCCAFMAGGSGLGAALSRDSGETWSHLRGLDRHYGWAVATDPADSAIWYVSASPGPRRAHSEKGIADAYIYRADGKKWKKLGGGLPQPLNWMPYALLTDPASPGHVCAGLKNGEVWHSDDCGDSWEKLPFNLGRIEQALAMLR